MITPNTEQFLQTAKSVAVAAACSRVREVIGPVIRADNFPAAIGDEVTITSSARGLPIPGKVIAFTARTTVLAAFEATESIRPGSIVRHIGRDGNRRPDPMLLGCVVDSLGRPTRRMAAPDPTRMVPAKPRAESSTERRMAAERKLIREPLVTGCRAVDLFATLGKGQRLCILAEPGVGKSTLLATIAKRTAADVIVVGLIGERGREVQEFIEEALSPETRQRTVIVASTSDESSLSRATAPITAQRIAEHFCDAGLDVLLQVDSLTRYARALRELGLAAGEIPVRRGYPPSVFTKLPELIERSGNFTSGSITALYTVLASGAVDEDPLVEEIKALTDGHLILSKQLADRGRFPALDVLRSLSRLQSCLLTPEENGFLREVRSCLARHESERDLLAFGAAQTAETRQAARYDTVVADFLAESSVEREMPSQLIGKLHAALLGAAEPART